MVHFLTSCTLLLATIAIAFRAAVCAQYECTNDYSPSEYVGHPRVPPECELQPLACPSSWKPGVPQGQSTALPLIDVNFIQCHEGFLCCGYVPIDSKTGEVLGMSGVTVGSGVDLGSKDSAYLTAIGVSQTIADALEPYYGLTRDDAACAAIELPLELPCSDAQALTDAVKNDVVSQIEQRYDEDREGEAVRFVELPRGIRTAIADVWFQFGSPTRYPKFWSYVIRNDWENAVKELRDFYGEGVNPPRGDLIRRNDEADIIEAALAKCNRSADIVFLLDESGSIADTDFQSSLNFVRSIIDAFPEEKLSSEDGTRFGLSFFNDAYRVLFLLSSYKQKSQYFTSLSSVSQQQGGTHLGEALNRVLVDQFTQDSGLRPEASGLPTILIVMTDGQSDDEVAVPASRVQDNNIVVYAIGIGSYDSQQLNAVASSPDHVKLLATFSDLTDFAATLTASSCYEPQPVQIGTDIEGKVEQDRFEYYKYNTPGDNNLKVTVTDNKGSTFMYASRENPHPYEYDNDFGFSSASQASKEIVISPISDNSKKRRTADANFTIYISVKGASSEALYTLVSSTCNPDVCSEGTNESSNANFLQSSIYTSLLVTATAIIMTR